MVKTASLLFQYKLFRKKIEINSKIDLGKKLLLKKAHQEKEEQKKIDREKDKHLEMMNILNQSTLKRNALQRTHQYAILKARLNKLRHFLQLQRRIRRLNDYWSARKTEESQTKAGASSEKKNSTNFNDSQKASSKVTIHHRNLLHLCQLEKKRKYMKVCKENSISSNLNKRP